MKRIVFALLTGVTLTTVNAQDAKETVTKIEKDTTWIKGGNLGLNLSQTSFNNWAAGGENSVSGTGLVNLFANKKAKRYTWDNTLDLAYGLIQQGTADVIKSDDKIDFSSKYGQHAFKKWYYSGLLNFKTQFAPGYSNPTDVNKTKISDFLSPAYLVGALGFDYKHNKYWSVFISPIAGKITIVNSTILANAGAFGVEAAEYSVTTGEIIKNGENIRNEFGAHLKAEYKKDIMQNVNIGSKLGLFSNYMENPERIDVNLEVLLTMKVNKYITSTISAELLYDHDQITEAQLKQVIAVGFSYKL